MALFKSKGSSSSSKGALNSISDKFSNNMQMQNFSALDPDGSIAGGKQNLQNYQNGRKKMSGIPSVIGRVARMAAVGVAVGGGLFSRKG